MKTLADHDGLLFSAQIDEDGNSSKVDLNQLHPPCGPGQLRWLHMCAVHPDTLSYMQECTEIDELVISALLAEDTRPRMLERDNGTMLILRTMNFIPGNDPEDMISLRIWIEENSIITFRLRDPIAISDMIDLVEANNAPSTVGDFVTAITDRIYSRMEPVIDQLEDETAELEELIAKKILGKAQDAAAPLRIKTAIIRRHLIPQHTALKSLLKVDPDWLDQLNAEQLIESDDHITRHVENLNDIRDRLTIINDEISRQNDQKLAATSYLFTLAATIFLPLTFVTGLLGVNIGGIPGVESHLAFPILVGISVLAIAVQIYVFRRKGWF